MCKLTTPPNVVILRLGFKDSTGHVFLSVCQCLSMHISDLSRKYVSSVVSLVLLLK